MRKHLILAISFLITLGWRQHFASATPARNPHGALAIDCGTCHTTESWSDSRRFQNFDHRKTTFPLTGQHAGIKCVSCHTSLQFKGTSLECDGCHKDIHKGELGVQCDECHNTVQWSRKEGQFVEHQRSRFPLMGAHILLDCRSCHPRTEQGEFRGAPLDCEGCHLTEYQATSNPPHRAAGFPANCRECHNANTWQDIKFNHTVTGFPLIGPHKTAECRACHANTKFLSNFLECHDCHQKDFISAKDPDHVAAGFQTNCPLCHTILAWSPSIFNHNTTQFPLTGAHRTVECKACHINNLYAGTPLNCSGCHLKDYQGATNPNHLKAGFSTTCQECHLTADWQHHRYSHPAFILLGAHRNITCNDCHVNDNFTTIPSTCYGCHNKEYSTWPDPDHQKAGFSQSCEECHSQTAWIPTTYNHDSRYFPVYTGIHAGIWKSCSNPCHPDQNHYADFQCVVCHDHEKTLTDNQHKNVPGYQYANVPCYNCHPRGTK